MKLQQKIGGIPAWGWGVAIVGGLVVGIYLRHRAKSGGSAPTTAQLTTAAGGGDTSLPTPGLDSAGVLAGLFQQQADLLAALLASIGGSAASGTAPTVTTPGVSVASSSGSGASPSPNPAAPSLTDPTFAAPTTTYAIASGGVPVGVVSGPVMPIGAPAADLYRQLGYQPSDPVTVLPDSAFSTSTAPNAVLSTQAQAIPLPGKPVAV